MTTQPNEGILQYTKKPRFRLLTRDGRKTTEDLRRSVTLTERLADGLTVAEDAIDSASWLFRGIYRLPLAYLGKGVESIDLPWCDVYFDVESDCRVPNAAAEVDIEVILDHLGEHGCEFRRGGTFLIQAPERTDRWILQSLAVEVMLAVDNELVSIKAGDLEGALWWQAIALENLIECQGQANVVLEALRKQ